MNYEAHCYCMKNENGETQKKCMWRGIEYQLQNKYDLLSWKISGLSRTSVELQV